MDEVIIRATSLILDGVTVGPGSSIDAFSIVGQQPAGPMSPLGWPSVLRPTYRSHTVIYAGNRIGTGFQTGHGVLVRELNVIGDNVSIGSHTVIEHHVSIGDGVRIHSNAFIPEFTTIEAGAWVGPCVVMTNAMYPGSPRAKEGSPRARAAVRLHDRRQRDPAAGAWSSAGTPSWGPVPWWCVTSRMAWSSSEPGAGHGGLSPTSPPINPSPREHEPHGDTARAARRPVRAIPRDPSGDRRSDRPGPRCDELHPGTRGRGVRSQLRAVHGGPGGSRRRIGTAAIHLALLACGVGPGDEVITPAHTFIATAEAISLSPARGRCSSTSTRHLRSTRTAVEAAITPRTKASCRCTCTGRWPTWTRSWRSRAGWAALIEDAAQAHGAQSRAAGRLDRRAGCFSFYPGKNLGAFGEGGGHRHGSRRASDRFGTTDLRGSHYMHTLVGTNGRLDALQAAVLSAKLAVLDEWNGARRRIASRYRDAFGAIGLPMVDEESHSRGVYHLAVVRVPRRTEVRALCDSLGIQTGVHYPTPIHCMYPYAQLAPEPLPVAESAAAEVLSLPIFPHMREDQVSGPSRRRSGVHGMSANIVVVGLGYWGPNLARAAAGIRDGRLYGVCDADPARVKRLAGMYPAAKAFGSSTRCSPTTRSTPSRWPHPWTPTSPWRGRHSRPAVTYSWRSRWRAPARNARASSTWRPRISVCSWSATCSYTTGYSYVQEGIEDVVFATADYPHGANIHISWLDPQKVRLMTVVGSRKMIVYDDTQPDARVMIYDKGVSRVAPANLGTFETFGQFQLLHRAGDVLIPKVDFVEPLQVEMQHFVDCIRDGATPLTDGRAGLEVVRALEAAQRSMAEEGVPSRWRDGHRRGWTRRRSAQVELQVDGAPSIQVHPGRFTVRGPLAAAIREAVGAQARIRALADGIGRVPRSAAVPRRRLYVWPSTSVTGSGRWPIPRSLRCACRIQVQAAAVSRHRATLSALPSARSRRMVSGLVP